MYSKEKLYETFGELLYAIALADGRIQDAEVSELKEMIKFHPLAKDIFWSFNYEKGKGTTVEAAYNKAIDIFKHHGPAAEYKDFEEILAKVATACEGISPEEKDLIERFRKDLTGTFQNDSNIK